MILLFCGLAILLLLGIPVGYALAGASVLFLLLTEGSLSPQILYRMIGGVDSFPLLSIPFFILAGTIMNSGGITTRIFDFATALMGWTRGGLGHVNVGASVIFSGMSGAAVADVGGLGAVEIKAMRDAGYDDDFSVGITAASSIIGPIIPPSLPLIIYGVVASESIGQLFLAGVVPGIFTALALSLTIVLIARKRGYKPATTFSFARIGITFRKAFLPLLTPVIIIGGIMAGVFTPTEAAVAACAYALFLSVVVYRSMSWKSLVGVSMETASTTASILIIVAGAAIFSWLLTANNIGVVVQDFMLGITADRYVILLIIALLTLIVGCFMETIAAITILTPIFLPAAVSLGVDPIQFGIFFVFTLMIGLLTPPIGMVLFVLGKVADVTPGFVFRSTMLFALPLLVTILALIFVPELSTALPNFVYAQK